jgi:hypothetical protein
MTFETLKEALKAGYRLPDRKKDKDITKTPFFGYDYQNENGEKTVDVYLTKEKNKAKSLGCSMSMYPPNKTGHCQR